MFRKLLILLILFFTGCSAIEKTAIYGSFANSPIKGQDLTTQTVGVRFDVDTTRYTKLPPKYGNIDLGFEFYGGIVQQGSSQHHTYGTTAFLRYSYPLGDLAPYLEVGAGPTILSVRTYEQEKSGFAFRDQFGTGLEYRLSPDLSIWGGYRYEHLSHGGLRSTRNRGVESHIGLFGIVIHY